MRGLLKNPLTWMVVGECAIVAALLVLAWHLVAGAAVQNGVPVVVIPPAAAPSTDPMLAPPDMPSPPPLVRRPLPGLNVGVGFWRIRLADLNRDQAALEALEWRIIHSAMEAVHRYIESVVIPAVVRAERPG